MILVTLTVFVPPGRWEEIVDVFWLLLGPLRVEPGCLTCALYREVGDGEGLLYVEEWETAEQLERHMRSSRYDLLLAVMEASARPPVLRYHSVSGTRGLEYLEAVRLGRGAAPRPPESAVREMPERAGTPPGREHCQGPG
jgi:quinol monooxygenase YgiN